MLKRVEEIQGLGLWLRIRLVSQYIKNWPVDRRLEAVAQNPESPIRESLKR